MMTLPIFETAGRHSPTFDDHDAASAWFHAAADRAEADLHARPDVHPNVLYVCAIGATDHRGSRPLPSLSDADAQRAIDLLNEHLADRSVTSNDVIEMLRALAAEVV